MNKSTTSDRPFAPYTKRASTAECVALLVIFLVAIFLRLYRLDEVPPGIHDDEVINARIVESLYNGAPLSVFYKPGEGREGLYYPLLLLSRSITAQVPYWYRLPSVVLSLLSIWLIYRLWRRRFGPWPALVAAGGMAIIFWPVLLAREALRVNLIPPMGAAMTIAMFRGLEHRERNVRSVLWFALAGLLLGLLQYTYPAARVLPLAVVGMMAYLAIAHRQRLNAHWPSFALLLAIALVVALPLGIYLVNHWEDQVRILSLAGPLDHLMAGNPLPVLSATLKTFAIFFVRGYPLAHYNYPGRPLMEPVSGALFLGGVALAAVNWRKPANAFAIIWTLVSMIPGMLSEPAPHFPRTTGILITVFAFVGLAVRWIVARLDERDASDGVWGRILSRRGLVAALGILAVFNIGWTFRDYFHRWPFVQDTRGFRHAMLAEAANYLDAADESTPVAMCTSFLNEQHFFWRTDRQALPYLLNRDDLAFSWYSCPRAQVFPRGGATARYLFPEETSFAPFLPEEWDLQGETVATLREGRIVELNLEDEVSAWLSGFEKPDAPSLTFNETMSLVGYELDPEALQPGGYVDLLTAWSVETRPPRNLAIFVHLLDSDGDIVAQGDAFAALSDAFSSGDIFVQYHGFGLPDDLPAGEYHLNVGLYVRDGVRLTLPSSQDGALTLMTVQVDDADD